MSAPRDATPKTTSVSIRVPVAIDIIDVPLELYNVPEQDAAAPVPAPVKPTPTGPTRPTTTTDWGT